MLRDDLQMFDQDWIYRNVFEMTDDDIVNITARLRAEQARSRSTMLERSFSRGCRAWNPQKEPQPPFSDVNITFHDNEKQRSYTVVMHWEDTRCNGTLRPNINLGSDAWVIINDMPDVLLWLADHNTMWKDHPAVTIDEFCEMLKSKGFEDRTDWGRQQRSEWLTVDKAEAIIREATQPPTEKTEESPAKPTCIFCAGSGRRVDSCGEMTSCYCQRSMGQIIVETRPIPEPKPETEIIGCYCRQDKSFDIIRHSTGRCTR